MRPHGSPTSTRLCGSKRWAAREGTRLPEDGFAAAVDDVDTIRVADRLGATVSQVAIAWVLHQPGVSAAIAGSHDGSHMRENASAAVLDLSNVLSEIEQLVELGPAFASPR